MKKCLLFILTGVLSSSLISQTIATDFTLNDCAGNSKHLFAELDAGKVIVICWVMPCFSCTGPAITASSIVASYEATNPGKVIYYVADDYANTNCTSLSSWGLSNNVKPDSYFSNAALKMTDYGSNGMPKVVVLAGTDHKVYFNKNDGAAGDAEGIQSAINTALAVLSGIDDVEKDLAFIDVFPNPAGDNIHISFTMLHNNIPEIEVSNLVGENIAADFTLNQKSNKLQIDLNTSEFPNGVYILKAGSETVRFIVSHE